MQNYCIAYAYLLHQVRASHRPARAWFLRIVSVWMYVCVCLPPRLLITSGIAIVCYNSQEYYQRNKLETMYS